MELLLPGVIRDELESSVREIVGAAPLHWYDGEGSASGSLERVTGLFRYSLRDAQLTSLMARMPQLRWLHVSRAGVDGTLLALTADRPIALSNSSGMHAVPIGEYVLWAILAHAKQARLFAERQRRRVWRDDDVGLPQLDELPGKTLLIIGLGRIGLGIAQRAQAFGMRVIGASRSGRPQPYVDTVVAGDSWRAWLAEADYLVLSTPLTAETRGMIGAAELALIPPHCYLINVARGDVIDEAALVEALREQRLAGATLDVFAQEPLPAEHPLWALPTVTITPHMSWESPRGKERTIQIFLDNLAAFAAGRTLPNQVDKAAGY